LLELMVTVAGVFLAPSYLPLLAALIFRGLTWRGAVLGYCTGIASGFTMLIVRSWWVVEHYSDTWVRGFDGGTILLNTAVTIVGMWIGSIFLPSDAKEKAQIKTFFEELREPVATVAAAAGPRGAIAKTTIAVGALLGVAALLSRSLEARVIDCAVALILVAIGMYMRRGARMEAAELAGAGPTAAH
jgi:Na+(H+)/acetate symporter ActP